MCVAPEAGTKASCFVCVARRVTLTFLRVRLATFRSDLAAAEPFTCLAECLRLVGLTLFVFLLGRVADTDPDLAFGSDAVTSAGRLDSRSRSRAACAGATPVRPVSGSAPKAIARAPAGIGVSASSSRPGDADGLSAASDGSEGATNSDSIAPDEDRAGAVASSSRTGSVGAGAATGTVAGAACADPGTSRSSICSVAGCARAVSRGGARSRVSPSFASLLHHRIEEPRHATPPKPPAVT